MGGSAWLLFRPRTPPETQPLPDRQFPTLGPPELHFAAGKGHPQAQAGEERHSATQTVSTAHLAAARHHGGCWGREQGKCGPLQGVAEGEHQTPTETHKSEKAPKEQSTAERERRGGQRQEVGC